MAVQAHNNAFGFFDRFISGSGTSQRTRISNGQSDPKVAVGCTLIDNHCERYHKSSNPILHFADGRPYRKASPYYRKVIQHNWEGGNLTVYNGRYAYSYSGLTTTRTDVQYAWPTPWRAESEIWDSDGHNRSIVECLLKLNDGKVSLSTYLAESVRSANMLADAFSTLARGIIAVKRGNIKSLIRMGLREPTSTLANGYLSYKYGWKPLMSDLYLMTTGLQDNLKPEMYLSARRRVSTPHHVSGSFEYGGTNINRSAKTMLKHETKLVARVKDDLLVQAQNLDIINPASLAWELIPYSFVVDWALPIGNVLAALTATQGLEFVDGYSTEVRTGKCRLEFRPLLQYTGSPEAVNMELFSMTRVPHGGFPRPIPYAKNPFSTSNVLSAVALARQLLRR